MRRALGIALAGALAFAGSAHASHRSPVQATQLPAFTGGDCTTPAGSVVITCSAISGLAVGAIINFGGSSFPGGRIVSSTSTNGGSIIFGNGVSIFDFGGSQQYKFSTIGAIFALPMRFSGGTVSAAGTSLATATALANDVNVVNGGTGGVSLAAYNTTYAGIQRQEVSNVSGASISVYPPSSSATIWNLNGSTSAGAAGAAVTLANGTHGTFECYSSTACVEAP